MKCLIKRVFVFALLIVMMWFGSIMADKKYLRDEIICLHVLSQPDIPISSEVTSTMQTIVSSFFQDGFAVLPASNDEKKVLSSNLTALEQKIDFVFEDSDMYHNISVDLKNAENTEQEHDGFFVPAGVFRTIEIHVGDVREGGNRNAVILDCIFRQDNIRLSFLKKYSLRYHVLNFIGILENIFCLG